MNEALDEAYLTWLYETFFPVRRIRSSRTYRKLAHQLFTKEFFWSVPNDDNRAADGCALRYEFLDACGRQHYEAEWMDADCSMLEMLAGVAKHLAFEMDGLVEDWFWHLLQNLGLSQCNDKQTYSEADVENKLNRLNNRNYSKCGDGGLFPIQGCVEDMRRVEIWDQMSAYLIELR